MKKIAKKTPKMLVIESKYKLPIEEVLRVLYVGNNLSIKEVAEKLETTYRIAREWLELAGIYSRRLW